MRIFLIYVLPTVLVAMLVLRFVGESVFRVNKEPMPVDLSVPDTRLSAMVDGLLNEAAKDGESLVYPLGNARQAFATRMELADAATISLYMQYYLFHDDYTGRALLGAAVHAANRGVKVRLLLDDMDTLGRDGYFSRLVAEHQNLEIRIFNPSFLRSFRPLEYLARFPRVTRRMHNKAFIVDGVISVVGGRNIGNEYFDINTDTAFDDFDVVCGGDVSRGVTEEFYTYWHSGLAVDAARLGEPVGDKAYQDYLSVLEQARQKFYQTLESDEGSVFWKIYNQKQKPYYGPGKVIYDRPEKVVSKLFDTSHNLSGKIVQLMDTAQEELLISSPYFIPGNMGMRVFRRLRERGVEITVITNSFAANDVALVHAGYMDYRRELVEIGVNLYELKPTTDNRELSFLGSKHASLHAKSFIVDQSRIYVGSFNLDPRSAIHNTEMGVVFYSEDYGKDAHQRARSYLGKNAWHVTINEDGKLIWRGNNPDSSVEILNKEPMTGFFGRLLIYCASWLPVDWLL